MTAVADEAETLRALFGGTSAPLSWADRLNDRRLLVPLGRYCRRSFRPRMIEVTASRMRRPVSHNRVCRKPKAAHLTSGNNERFVEGAARSTGP